MFQITPFPFLTCGFDPWKIGLIHWLKLSETLLHPVHYFQIFMGGINILWGGQYILKGGPPGGASWFFSRHGPCTGPASNNKGGLRCLRSIFCLYGGAGPPCPPIMGNPGGGDFDFGPPNLGKPWTMDILVNSVQLRSHICTFEWTMTNLKVIFAYLSLICQT